MKKRFAIIAFAALPLSGCSLMASHYSEPVPVEAPAPTLPPCPEVTYDGNLNGPGPIWSTPDGLPPTYDCVGPAHTELP